jgi:aryl carrier-like protein
VLVVTQIIRLIQNAVQLHRQNDLIKRQLDGVKDIEQIDIENQRKMHKLVIEYLERKNSNSR